MNKDERIKVLSLQLELTRLNAKVSRIQYLAELSLQDNDSENWKTALQDILRAVLERT